MFDLILPRSTLALGYRDQVTTPQDGWWRWKLQIAGINALHGADEDQ